MKSIKLLTLIALCGAASAFATELDCNSEKECFSQGLRLIRASRSITGCENEANAAARAMADGLNNENGQALVKLDSCIETAKLTKKYNDRLKKINKALAGS